MSRTVLGVLMLDTSFPRPVGDIGNPESFDHPVIYRKLPGAIVSRVVTHSALPDDLVELIIAEAKTLQSEGATIITTSCGFLSPLQQQIQTAVSVPVITSALWMLPVVRAQVGQDAPIGIVTFDASRLSPHHVPDAGPLAVEGLQPDDHLYQVISRDLPDLDIKAAQKDFDSAVQRLIARVPDLRSLILECTNLPPYRFNSLIRLNYPTFDILDAIKHLQNTRKL